MPRLRIRHLFLLLFLAAGYWTYGRMTAVDPDSLPPALAEATPALRLAAMHSLSDSLAAADEVDAPSVEIQHLLIAFAHAGDSGDSELATRTQAAAEQLAADLFSELRAGADFDDLVLAHSDDSPPGLFVLATDLDQLDPDLAADAIARAEFVPAIGDVSWRLEVGQVGVASYDAERCPLGWHLIKRLR